MLLNIEGIDGAGKGTLTRHLLQRAHAEGLKADSLSFPRYEETKFSKLVADYLNGTFGGLADVPPQFASLLYAGDRFESRSKLITLIETHDLIILDRYVYSNAAYNGAKLDGIARTALIDWIYETEFGLFELPQPDLICLLTTDVTLSNELIARKDQRSYTNASHDLHEEARDYMSIVAEVYQELSSRENSPDWLHLNPMDETGALRPPEIICEELWQSVAANFK